MPGEHCTVTVLNPANFRALETAFRRAFPEAPPPRFCRAPGRVNLIGEHTDYNGMPVLPMTIDRDLIAAYSPRSDRQVRIASARTHFGPAEWTNAKIVPPSPQGHWANYVKAAVQGVNARLRPRYAGMNFLVNGNLPPAAGLSSSAALVITAALAYLDVLGLELDQDVSRFDLAQWLAEAERYVGVQSGGMDQAIILLGAADTALKIDFHPLRAERAPLPKDHAVIVCHSTIPAPKSGPALVRYNEGPVSSRLMVALIEHHLREEIDPDLKLERLGDLWHGHLCLTYDEVEGLFDSVFKRDGMTYADIANTLGVSVDELRRRWADDFPEPPGGFALKARARHLRTEYRRVEEARDALLAGDTETLGRLMIASHKSCAQDFFASCAELDRLVESALEAGAIGARMTGAGFGGCTVNLVPNGLLEDFIDGVSAMYYKGHFGLESTQDLVMPVQAAPAAGYLDGR